jgi:hypothetical protein
MGEHGDREDPIFVLSGVPEFPSRQYVWPPDANVTMRPSFSKPSLSGSIWKAKSTEKTLLCFARFPRLYK